MNRRGFLRFLGTSAVVAPVLFDPHRVIFDMGRSLLPAASPHIVTIDELTKTYIIPRLADEVLKPSSLYTYLKERERIDPDGHSFVMLGDDMSVHFSSPVAEIDAQPLVLSYGY
jgi:hypothetical protein